MSRVLLLPPQVAERVGVTVGTLTNWRCLGIGPPWLKVGFRIRYVESELNAWLPTWERRGARSPAPEDIWS